MGVSTTPSYLHQVSEIWRRKGTTGGVASFMCAVEILNLRINVWSDVFGGVR